MGIAPKLTKNNAVAVFSIQRDGSITDAELAESSGNSEVDASAMAALKAASPLSASYQKDLPSMCRSGTSLSGKSLKSNNLPQTT